MRQVTVRHKDERGTTQYTIYETREQLLAEKPNAVIKDTLLDAKVGEYIVAENGWMVPLIAIAYMKNDKIRALRGIHYQRKKPIYYIIYHFPKDRKVFRLDKLDKAIFNYTPTNYNGIASENKRCRFHELSARKIRWAQLVAHGTDTFEATREAFPQSRNVHKTTKLLLSNEAVQRYVRELTPKKEKVRTLRDALKEAGMLEPDFLMKKMQDYLDDPKSPLALKKWAVKMISDVRGWAS